MFKRIASLLLLAALGLVVAGAVNDAPSLASYPVLLSATTFVLTALTVVPIILRPLPEARVPTSPNPASGRGARGHQLRIAAFCAVWILYAGLLNTMGFVLASSLAMIASLWIVMGRFKPIASLASVVFVLALAVLVTTILFVPVPKAQVDHLIDETIFTLMGN